MRSELFKSKMILFLLLISIIMGGYLRFIGIKEKGLTETDEVISMLEGKWLYTGFKSYLSTFDIEYTKKHTEGQFLHYGRPLMALLIAIWYFILGGIRDYAGSSLSAFFGTLSILLIYCLGKKLYNEKVGILASICLAVSNYHIMNSRIGIPDATNTFILLFITYLYYITRIDNNYKYRYLFLTGLLTGLAFTIHSRAILIIFVIGLYEIHLILTQKPFISLYKIKRWLVLLISFLILPFLVQITYVIFEKTILKEVKGIITHERYLDYYNQIYIRLIKYPIPDLTKRSLQEIKHYNNLENWYKEKKPTIAYFIYLWKFENILILSFLAIGLYVTLKRRRLEDILILLQFLGPFLLVTSGRGKEIVPRHLSYFIPAMILIVAVGINSLSRIKNLSLSKIGNTIVIILIISIGIYNSKEILSIKSGTKEAINYIREIKGTEKLITDRGYFSIFYVGSENVKNFEYFTTKDELKYFYKNGYRYLFVNNFHKHFMHLWRRYLWPTLPPRLLQEIESKCKPIYIARDTRGTSLLSWYEECVNIKRTINFFNKLPYQEKYGIRIYDLSHYFDNKVKR